MAKRVVKHLKVIEIDIGDGKAGAATLRTCHFPLAGAFKTSAIECPSQWIGERRIARFSISSDGEFSLPGKVEALDWSRVVRVDFGWSYPWGASPLDRVALGALEVSFGFADGSVVRLARGPLWRVKPTHEPVGFIALGRWLADRATAAGMVVTNRPDEGFTALRR